MARHSTPIRCDTCRKRLKIGDYPYCPHGSAFAHPAMKPYEIEIRGRKVVIDSIQKARMVEKAEMQAYHDGVPGAKPLALRVFHQDSSNMDKSVDMGFGRQSQGFRRQLQNIRGGFARNESEMRAKIQRAIAEARR